jgi:hypothetical protein
MRRRMQVQYEKDGRQNGELLEKITVVAARAYVLPHITVRRKYEAP